ncbi:hypothetical protein H1P_420007 [Hyella patelloides LEGE 07179]|uniref:Uncharacterized protein n=1 Tax=Hyella patelloides LEGE 07179 TaxID=945734 RepID=A0A563VXQ1_9CYAN|nr:hypothetical protein H1P_420007 [Hyella patelloides LEGE 07179]
MSSLKRIPTKFAMYQAQRTTARPPQSFVRLFTATVLTSS